MKLSTVFLAAAIALAIGAGIYWYQSEGSELFEQIRQSENKPFFLNEFDN